MKIIALIAVSILTIHAYAQVSGLEVYIPGQPTTVIANGSQLTTNETGMDSYRGPGPVFKTITLQADETFSIVTYDDVEMSVTVGDETVFTAGLIPLVAGPAVIDLHQVVDVEYDYFDQEYDVVVESSVVTYIITKRTAGGVSQSSTAVTVPPTDGTTHQVELQMSMDLTNWTPVNPGFAPDSDTPVFYRVAIKN